MDSDQLLSRWFALGTCGGPFPNAAAFQISNALVVGEDVYLFDVGNGVLHQLMAVGIDPSRIRAVFVTHHHPDHIADLGLVLLTHWLSPGRNAITVCGPRGTASLVDGLAAAYAAVEATEDPTKPAIRERVVVQEADGDNPGVLEEIFRDGRIVVDAIEVAHFRSPTSTDRVNVHAIGLRIRTPDRSIAYTGDTGATPALGTLARGVDLLVSEVVDVPRIVSDLQRRFPDAPSIVERVVFNMHENHLSAESIGLVAASAEVGEVLLTHFVPLPEDRGVGLVAEASAKAGGIRVTAAQDLEAY